MLAAKTVNRLGRSTVYSAHRNMHHLSIKYSSNSNNAMRRMFSSSTKEEKEGVWHSAKFWGTLGAIAGKKSLFHDVPTI
jgi:hypothetical protein